MHNMSMLAIPTPVLVAVVGTAVALFGWRSFEKPRLGVLAILAMLPVLKTAGSDGLFVRLALPDMFTFITCLGVALVFLRDRHSLISGVHVPWQVLAALFLLALATLISLTVTQNPDRTLTEMFAYFVDVVLFSLIVLMIRTKDQLLQCMRAWEVGVMITMVGALIGVVLIFSGVFNSYWTEGPKLTGTFKKSGQLSAYIMPTLPLLWFSFRYQSTRRWHYWARGLLMGLAILALLSTGSRTGLVLGAGILFFLFGGRWLRGLFGKQTGLRLALFVSFCVLTGAVIKSQLDNLPYAFQRAFSIASKVESLESLSPSRYYQFLGWRVAASEYPLTGVGAGDFKSRNTSFVPASWTAHEIHNTYFGVWAENGILGICALALLYLGVLQSAWRSVARSTDPTLRALGFALFVSTFVLIAYGMSNFGLRMRHLWAIFGLVVVLSNVVRAEVNGPDDEGEPAPAR